MYGVPVGVGVTAGVVAIGAGVSVGNVGSVGAGEAPVGVGDATIDVCAVGGVGFGDGDGAGEEHAMSAQTMRPDPRSVFRIDEGSLQTSGRFVTKP